MITNKTIDTQNGEEVAKALSLYLNTFSSRKEFHPIFAAYKRPAHNFTVLILQWLYHLSCVTYYDKRNEASVLLAREITCSIPLYDDYDYQSLLQHTSAVKKPVIEITDFRSHDEMALVLSCYLTDKNAKNGIYKSFVQQMLYEHKTLQQSFMRFCRDWCNYVINEKPFGASSKTIKLAKPLAESKNGLPMI